MSPTNQRNHSTVEEALRILGEGRRRMGAEVMQSLPHPGVDPRLADAARILVECAYVDGDFGDGDRDEAWLKEKADYLAAILQGAYEDWAVENEAHS